MDTSLLTILPNLSIGVISVLSLVYVVRTFMISQSEMRQQHETSMRERELALREVEQAVRNTISDHLAESTHAVRENTKALERVINHLDSK